MWRWVIWLTRVHRCRGFGIQSPTDYAFVRYVINEHWPYYAYETLGKNDDWKTRKLGRLYMRLANWRQPERVESNGYEEYWKAGRKKVDVRGKKDDGRGMKAVEVARVDIDDDRETVEDVLDRCNERSVVVVEDIWRDWQRWHELEQDERVGTTYDLYYCGIMLFDKRGYKHHYKVNF